MAQIRFNIKPLKWVLFFSYFLTACYGTDSGKVLGSDAVSGNPARVPAGIDPSKGAGSGCHNADPNHICLAVKYVAFADSNDQPAVTTEQGVSNFEAINQVWKQCNISFQIEDYFPIKPSRVSIPYNIANYSDLTDIRETFADDKTLLVVTTGTWDRSGSLGQTGANAWTSLPGGGPYGAILEKPVATYANIIAHELGHYLNLNHVSNEADIMNPIIYTRSTQLDPDQCATARSAALYFWTKMIR